MASLFSFNASASGVCDPGEEWLFDFPNCWYGGAGLGFSYLQPDDSNTAWQLSDKTDSGFKLQGGYHFLPSWFAEINYVDQGDAQVKNRNPAITGNEAVSYKVPELALGYYFLNPDEQRWNVFATVGWANVMSSSSGSRLSFNEVNNRQVSISVGAQYQISDHWFARTQLHSYAEDTRYIGFTLSRYFGGRAEPEFIVEIQSIVEPEELIAADYDQDGVLDNVDSCLPSALGVVVDAYGCAMFTGSLDEVRFELASYDLSGASQQQLDQMANTLRDYKLTLQVQGHTDSHGAESYNLTLSQQRAKAVVDYLVALGVNVEQLHTQTFGEASPSATNQTLQGRAQNRRVEFMVVDSIAESDF